MSFSFIKSKVFLLLTTLVFGAMLVGNVFAQSGTSNIRGTVTDQTGAAVPGATVTVNNTAVGFSRTTTTNNDGSYSFPGISAATYSLSVEAGNFKKAVSRSVRALVDSSTTLNISLEAGNVSATVDVTANDIESVVNTQDASLGNNFVPEQISELPTNLRRVTDLMSLQPGVTREGYVAGGRSDQANITLDGVDINDQQGGGRNGSTNNDRQFSTSQGSVLRSTTESTEEFRITTVNANASQGRSSGAQISLLTKSGTNRFAGSMFYFYRPTEFSANSFFNNLAGIERPSLARDVFGGSIGGPIIKDKLFFFYTYEGQRQELEQSVVRTVPLAHVGNGEMRFMGTRPTDPAGTAPYLVTLTTADLNAIYNQLPDLGAGMRMNPAAIAALSAATNAYPSNDSSVGDGVNTGGFRFNSPRTISENTHITKFDWNINDSQQLFVRGNYQWDISSGLSQFPDTPTTNLWQHPFGYAVGHNWTISSNMINNFRYGLTRTSFSGQGDSAEPNTSFRFVLAPRRFVRTLSRTTDTHNFTDDFTWLKGNHTINFGGNIRIVRNKRSSLGSAFDSAVTNPSFYDSSGAVLEDQLLNAGYTLGGGQTSIYQAAATALIGRYSQYSGNFTFDIDGSVVPAGTASDRNFATEEYEAYVQDQWRPFRNLTITGGLRYSIATPVYEQNGFQVVPDRPLGDIFEARQASALNGVPDNSLVNFQLGGKANNAPGFYPTDKNNWMPRVAVAYSPSFASGILNKVFGDEGESTFRGGFAITYDSFGQQLAVNFDGLSTIGFTSSTTISANTYNVTDRPAPLFTGYNQDIRSLPGIPAPQQLFSKVPSAGCLAGTSQCPQRIESSLDANIETPQHYTWNASYGRSLPKGMYLDVSYIGRRTKNLFASKDIMALNNLVDPASGLDWYTAMGMLIDERAAGTAVGSIATIPYFENLFPNFTNFFGTGQTTATGTLYEIIAKGPAGGFDFIDYTFIQTWLDDSGTTPNLFYHPQYAAFSAFGTYGKSNYHGATVSLRQRLGSTLSYDFNYTFSKSFDDASGLQTQTSGFSSSFILNPLRQQDNYSISDFDVKHLINANFIFRLPFGDGPMFDDSGLTKSFFLGGWTLAGVYRWNSGLPVATPFDGSQWATNWNAQSTGVRIADLPLASGGVDRDTQNIFTDNQLALNSFRNARAGETGDRNFLRGPSYQTLDLGLTKTIRFPWNEKHKLQLRVEAFNVLNYQAFATGGAGSQSRNSWGLGQDPETLTAPANFGKIYNDIQGSPRSMQFGVRYQF